MLNQEQQMVDSNHQQSKEHLQPLDQRLILVRKMFPERPNFIQKLINKYLGLITKIILTKVVATLFGNSLAIIANDAVRKAAFPKA